MKAGLSYLFAIHPWVVFPNVIIDLLTNGAILLITTKGYLTQPCGASPKLG